MRKLFILIAVCCLASFAYAGEDKADGITFKVAHVKATDKPLKTASREDILRAKGGAGIEASSLPEKGLVATEYHPLIEAAHRAYADHRPLVLSPDMIWLTILQGVAIHINSNPEKFRAELVSHEGRKELRVRRDDFVKGSPDNDWESAFSKMCDLVAQNTNSEFAALLGQKFSTTGPRESMAFHAAALEAMDSYFGYSFDEECGIPDITLEGKAEDWAMILEQIEILRKLDLEWWLEELRPVLKEFHSAAAGEGNREFWLKLYKAEEQCAKSDAVTGWIVKFFPYTLNGVNGYRKNEWLKTDWQEVRHEGPEMGYFPRGLSKVQFKYIHDKKETPMELLAGFVAIEQKIDLSLRPAIGWMVRESGNGASEIEQQQALIRDRERLKKVIEKKLGENCEVYSYDRHIVIKLNNFRKLDPDSRNNNGKNKISIYLTIKPALPPEECPKRDLLHYKFMKEIARYYKQEKNDEDIKADEYKILIIDDEFSPSEEIEKHRLPSFRWENYEINVQEGYYYKPGEENALDGAIADDEEGRKRLLAIRELFTPYVPAADEKPKK